MVLDILLYAAAVLELTSIIVKLLTNIMKLQSQGHELMSRDELETEVSFVQKSSSIRKALLNI